MIGCVSFQTKELEKELSNIQSKLTKADDRKLVAVEQERAKLDSATRQLEFERHANDGLKDVRLISEQMYDFMGYCSSEARNLGLIRESVKWIK